MKNKKGLFITFEGPEASGKSSQIKLLEKYLKKKNIPYTITREPGGTILAEKLRKIILSNKSNLNNIEEILLLMAGRSNHINNVILPNIKEGKIVISDRYADSTFVYQGFVNKFGVLKALKLHKELLNNFYPNYTFVFQIGIDTIIQRLKRRKIKNKYDKIDIKFHQNVVNGYNKICKSKRYFNIDATLSKNTIHNNILKILKI